MNESNERLALAVQKLITGKCNVECMNKSNAIEIIDCYKSKFWANKIEDKTEAIALLSKAVVHFCYQSAEANVAVIDELRNRIRSTSLRNGWLQKENEKLKKQVKELLEEKNENL